MEEICETPAELLASRDTAAACFDAAWQTVGGKGADFWNHLERFLNKKTAVKLAFLRFYLQTESLQFEGIFSWKEIAKYLVIYKKIYLMEIKWRLH